ncbi:DUF1476 domain-containing protein [Aureimonas sp. D3]|uniref:DUF1476 domain-containing protein n=1 Tax=Aureimonas sp. D3 TaxID=1638164 RepID=UPI0007834DCA|nr:DUF1476 domain-containing protein [Aureimonas sp. D3]
MSLFSERETAFEEQFAREEEVAFLLRVARERRFGLWAATRMGLDEQAGPAYARSLVEAAVRGDTEAQIVARVQRDLGAAGVMATPNELGQAMTLANEGARRQIVGADPEASGTG